MTNETKVLRYAGVLLAVLLQSVAWSADKPARHHDGAAVIVEWNRQLLTAAEAEDGFLTLKGVRTAAMMHLAMHDALNTIVPVYERYALSDGPRAADPVSAVAQAAHDVLVALYPNQQAALDAALVRWLAAAGPLRDRGVELGHAAASAILARREDDGWNTEAPYSFRDGPGQ